MPPGWKDTSKSDMLTSKQQSATIFQIKNKNKKGQVWSEGLQKESEFRLALQMWG